MPYNMKRVVLLVISILFAASAVAGEEITEKIDKRERWQTIEGWGSSLCWWAHMCGRCDEERVDKLLDLITSKDGLNMNIFRYNIGGIPLFLWPSSSHKWLSLFIPDFRSQS